MIFPVDENYTGISLLDYLASKLDTSKKKAKTLLNTRNVFVNNKRVWMARHILKYKDKVEIMTPSNIYNNTDPISILYEDKDYLIVNKSAGILSNGINSIEEIIRKKKKILSIASVHRLDKDTSGCLILAKTNNAYKNILPLFRKRNIKKNYHVIVAGRIHSQIYTITTPIDEKEAITHLKKLDANKKASHLLAAIKTGRTHQIRKHLASIKNPVIGDRYYGSAILSSKEYIKAGRQMLHASSLDFIHPLTGRKIRVKAPLPKDFRNCLKIFKLT